MKAKIKIKDFKSIRKIDNLELYSNQVNFFIGENNSGKSNILKSIIALNDDSIISKSQPEINPLSETTLTNDDLKTSVEFSFQYIEKEVEEIKKI